MFLFMAPCMDSAGSGKRTGLKIQPERKRRCQPAFLSNGISWSRTARKNTFASK